MPTSRDAETIGVLYKAMGEYRCPTAPALAQRLGVEYGPPLLVAIGVEDDPVGRWAEVETLLSDLQRRAVEARKPGFTTWLRNQRNRDDPVGDLAWDAAGDSKWPTRARTRVAFHTHLENSGAENAAQDALNQAWQEFTESRSAQQ